MSSVKNFTRLNSNKEFSKIYSKPTRTWHSEWFVLFFKESPKKNVAFVASKKIGNAVARNRAKRLLKAHFINYSDKLKSGQYIFVAKAPIINSDFKIIDKNLKKIYSRLKLFN